MLIIMLLLLGLSLWLESEASIPIYRWRQMRHGHLGGRGGWTKSYLSMYLLYIVFLSLYSLKKFLARYARSIAFYPQLTNANMQCVLPTPFIYFFFIFWYHYPWLPASKVQCKHAYNCKMAKNCLQGELGWQKRGGRENWGRRAPWLLGG